MLLNRCVLKVTVHVFHRSSQGCWRAKHEGPIHDQASEYVQTEAEMVIAEKDLHYSCELLKSGSEILQ